MLLKYLNPSITCTASDSRCAFGIFAPRGIRFCLIFCSMGDLVPQFTRFTPTRSWICTNMLSLSQESSYLQSSMFALLHTMWQNYSTMESQGTVYNDYTTSNLQSLHGLVPICCAFPTIQLVSWVMDVPSPCLVVSGYSLIINCSGCGRSRISNLLMLELF